MRLRVKEEIAFEKAGDNEFYSLIELAINNI